MVCTWDWQAIAGIMQAAAIVGAALIARSTVNDFLRTRAITRKAEIAEEAAQLGSSVVHLMSILRSASILREGLEFGANNAEHEESFSIFQNNVIAPIDALLPKAARLQELSHAGRLYFGDEYELACRRIGVALENFSQTAHGLVSVLTISRQRALLAKTDASQAVRDQLARLEPMVLLIEGKGNIPHATIEEALEVVRKTAAMALISPK